MLARANRVVAPDDFRSIVRRGRKTSSALAVYYRVARDASDPARFGFIVSRAIGNAVVRNRVRRRLRAAGRMFVDEGAHGADVVVRALPGCAKSDWATISADLRAAVGEPMIRAR